MKPIKVVLAALVLVCSLSANIGPPTVTYTVTGTSGDYTLDFTVNNNTNQDLYFFGTQLSINNITGSPLGFVPNYQPTWNNSGFGGSNITYNNNWLDPTFTSDPPGVSISGFDVTITDAVAPTSVNWFAYTFDNFGVYPPYTGGGNFYNTTSPGFEGVATISATPEPAFYGLLALGLGGLATIVSRRRKSAGAHSQVSPRSASSR
jgi:hypothetical protein